MYPSTCKIIAVGTSYGSKHNFFLAAFANRIFKIFPDTCCPNAVTHFRTYYFYEFGIQEQHAALVAAVNGGKVCQHILPKHCLLVSCQES